MLLGWKDVSEVLDFNDEALDENYLSGVIHRGVNKYKERPGFFTPYENVQEFAGELFAPIWYPLASTVGAAFMAFTAAISACYLVGYLFLGLFSIVAMNPEYRNTALEGVTNSLALVALTLIGTAAAALAAVLSIPHSIVSILTRSTASIFSNTECCAEETVFKL